MDVWFGKYKVFVITEGSIFVSLAPPEWWIGLIFIFYFNNFNEVQKVQECCPDIKQNHENCYSKVVCIIAILPLSCH